MKIEEAIVKIDNFFNPELLKLILLYSKKKCTKYLGIGRGEIGEIKEDVRRVKGYSLNENLPGDIIYYKHIQKEVTRAYVFYKAKFPRLDLKTQKLNQIDLLKYEIDGHYRTHIDHAWTTERTLSCIINLNDNYKGGNLIFYDPLTMKEIKRYELKKGTIVFFPSCFLYPHKIDPITEGVRYSIVAWLI